MTHPRRVLAVVPDLFFAAKIEAVARAAGTALAFAAPGAAAARVVAEPPDLVVLDLHAGPEVTELIRALKADERTRALPLLGFHSHVELETRRVALAAGLDRALPRSAFVARMPELFGGAAAPAAE